MFGIHRALAFVTCATHIVVVEDSHEVRACAEAVPAVELHTKALLEAIVQREELDTQFILASVHIALGIGRGESVFYDGEDVLAATCVVNLVVGEVTRLNDVCAGLNHLVRAAYGVGVEVLRALNLDAHFFQRFRTFLPIMYIACSLCLHHVLRRATKGLGVEVQASQECVREALGASSCILCAVSIVHHSHVGCIALQRRDEVCPNDMGLQ